MGEDTKRLNLPIDPGLHKRIRMAAAASEVSVPAFVKDLIITGLAKIEGSGAKGGKAA